MQEKHRETCIDKLGSRNLSPAIQETGVMFTVGTLQSCLRASTRLGGSWLTIQLGRMDNFFHMPLKTEQGS